MYVLSGDTRSLCDDMKDFSHDYIDYGNMAKQLIPDTNTVQHWSKIIETKYVRICTVVLNRTEKYSNSFVAGQESP